MMYVLLALQELYLQLLLRSNVRASWRSRCQLDQAIWSKLLIVFEMDMDKSTIQSQNDGEMEGLVLFQKEGSVPLTPNQFPFQDL